MMKKKEHELMPIPKVLVKKVEGIVSKSDLGYGDVKEFIVELIRMRVRELVEDGAANNEENFDSGVTKLDFTTHCLEDVGHSWRAVTFESYMLKITREGMQQVFDYLKTNKIEIYFSPNESSITSV